MNNRDQYGNKRLDLAGPLLAFLFRGLLKKLMKEMRMYAQKFIDKGKDFNLELAIYRDAGRICRPLLIVEDCRLLMKKRHIEMLKEREFNNYQWQVMIRMMIIVMMILMMTMMMAGPGGRRGGRVHRHHGGGDHHDSHQP